MLSVGGPTVVMDALRKEYPDFTERIFFGLSDHRGEIDHEFVQLLVDKGLRVVINGTTYDNKHEGPYSELPDGFFNDEEEEDLDEDY